MMWKMCQRRSAARTVLLLTVVPLLSGAVAVNAQNSSNGQDPNNNQNQNETGRSRGDRRDRARGGSDGGRRFRGGPYGGPGTPGGSGDNGGSPGGFRGFGRGGPGGFGNLSAQQREQIYNDRINRYVDEYGKAYNLNDSQKLTFQSQLQQLKSQSLSTYDQRHQQRQQLGDQMQKLRQRRDAGEQVDRSEFEKIGEQMRTTFSPMMNSEAVTSSLEQTLPPDQVAAGRKQLDQIRDQRRQDWQQRRGRDSNSNSNGQSPSTDNSGQPSPDGGNAAPNGDWRSRRRSWGDRSGGAGGGFGDGQASADGQNNGSDRNYRDDWRSRRYNRNDATPVDPNSIDGWSRYTRDFTRKYQLDSSQSSSAQSILRDVVEQRKQYETAHAADYTAAQQIADVELKRKQMEFLNAPIAPLFEQLKTKLDSLPTAAQRSLVHVDTPASQPAVAAGSQPSSDSGPSGRSNRRSFRDRSRSSG